jgi:hypothetical protein
VHKIAPLCLSLARILASGSIIAQDILSQSELREDSRQMLDLLGKNIAIN